VPRWFVPRHYTRRRDGASSRDIGWSAWSVEAGWGPAWIATTLGLRQRGASLWEITADSRIERHVGKVKPMLMN